jgi:hypothetical protein
MAPGSRYDKAKADRAVGFISQLCHTKGKWAGMPFSLLPWQETVIRDIFGTVKANGCRQFTTAFVSCSKKSGKQLSLDTPIPTPQGFATMGGISVGDMVYDEAGIPRRVAAKSEVDYSERAYRVTFKDGESVVAGESHLWGGECTHSSRPSRRVMSTGELYRLPREGDSIKFRIPVAAAIHTPQAAGLPIHPYLYGYWLGNGNAVKPEITVRTCDVSGVLANVLPYHAVSSGWANNGDSRVFRIPDLRSVLVKSFRDKAIPMAYLSGAALLLAAGGEHRAAGKARPCAV